MVAISSTLCDEIPNSLFCRPFSMFDIAFMIANMSALPQRIVVSTERLTGTPARRNDPTGVMPKPVRNSVYGLKLTGVLVSASSLRSSGVWLVA